MKFLLALLPISATVLAASSSSSLEEAAETPIIGVDTVHGCYSSVGDLQLNSTNTFNSQGLCTAACSEVGAYVAATHENFCYCGNTYPAASTLVDDSQCDVPCPGYDAAACGGPNAYTVYNTGLKLSVDNATDSGSDSSSTASSSSSSTASSASTLATAAPTASGSASNGTASTTTSASSAPTSTSAGTAAFKVAPGSVNLGALGLGLGAVFLM
ncbi:hypothetical protein BX600DRAFT_511191 [Xylariales sp. PMI_506]|nr:hypothetical protein BX600DRAFT_511191 [Xylariales sp. PMI_506]